MPDTEIETSDDELILEKAGGRDLYYFDESVTLEQVEAGHEFCPTEKQIAEWSEVIRGERDELELNQGFDYRRDKEYGLKNPDKIAPDVLNIICGRHLNLAAIESIEIRMRVLQ